MNIDKLPRVNEAHCGCRQLADTRIVTTPFVDGGWFRKTQWSTYTVEALYEDGFGNRFWAPIRSVSINDVPEQEIVPGDE